MTQPLLPTGDSICQSIQPVQAPRAWHGGRAQLLHELKEEHEGPQPAPFLSKG